MFGLSTLLPLFSLKGLEKLFFRTFTVTGALLAGTAAGGLAGSMASKSSKGGGYSGGGVVTLPQYSFTEPRLKLTSDFITQQLQNLQEGKPPPWLQNYLPIMQNSMRNDLYQTYYGLPGQRNLGVMDKALEAGSITGLGPKASTANVNKQLQNYAIAEKKIDDYINSLPLAYMASEAQYLPNQAMAIPQGPPSQVIAPQAIPQAPNFLGQSLGMMSAALPYMVGGGGGNVAGFGYTPGWSSMPASIPGYSW